MDNAKFIELIGDYSNNTLAPQERENFERKLNSDSNLVLFIKSYNITTSLCNQVLKHEIPERAQERLSAYLKGHIEPRNTKKL